MAFDEGLAERIRDSLAHEAGLSERKMFGGIAFMVDGNMATGVIGDDLMVRIGEAAFDEAIEQPGARVFDFTGRPMRGWVLVAPDVLTDSDDLAAWIGRGVAYAKSLPPK